MAKKALFLALDNSGSMAGTRADSLRAAVQQVLSDFSAFLDDPGNSLDLAICLWGNNALTSFYYGATKASLGAALARVGQINGSQGGTNFAAFAGDALAFFEHTLQSSYDTRALVFLTDGAPDPAGSDDTAATAIVDLLDKQSGDFSLEDGTAVDCFAANIESGNTTATQKLDNTGQDGVPVVSGGNSKPLTSYLRAVLLPTPQSRLWGFPVQWSDGFEEELAFRTEIITSRDGTEQRIGQRIKPRSTYDFRSVLRAGPFRQALHRAAFRQGGLYFVAHPRKPAALSQAAARDDNTLRVASVPDWLTAGSYVVLDDGKGLTELAVVISRSGTTLGLASGLIHSFRAGAAVRMAVEGRFDGATEITQHTTRAATVETKFSGDPVKTLHPTFGAAPEAIEGTEYFDMAPNWRNEMTVTFEQLKETLDLERGAVDDLFPISATARSMAMTFLCGTEDRIDRVLGLFYRSAGRRRRFLMPLWADEMRPVGVTFDAQQVFTFSGSELHEVYADAPFYRRLLVREIGYPDRIFNVTGIRLDALGNTIFDLDEPVDHNIHPDNITSMVWVGMHRFASDRLTISWRSDGVAEINVSVTSLEE